MLTDLKFAELCDSLFENHGTVSQIIRAQDLFHKIEARQNRELTEHVHTFKRLGSKIP